MNGCAWFLTILGKKVRKVIRLLTEMNRCAWLLNILGKKVRKVIRLLTEMNGCAWFLTILGKKVRKVMAMDRTLTVSPGFFARNLAHIMVASSCNQQI